MEVATCEIKKHSALNLYYSNSQIQLIITFDGFSLISCLRAVMYSVFYFVFVSQYNHPIQTTMNRLQLVKEYVILISKPVAIMNTYSNKMGQSLYVVQCKIINWDNILLLFILLKPNSLSIFWYVVIVRFFQKEIYICPMCIIGADK